MTERRTLSKSLTNSLPGVDSEAIRSFVSQRPATPPATLSAGADAGNSVAGAESQAGNFSELSRGVEKVSRFHPVGLIPVTVRLRPEIAGALKRASLERELAGEEVYTQQAIVEEALRPWLNAEGLLD